MNFIKNIIDWIRNKFFNKELDLSVVGIQNAGKSTLFNSLATGKFDENSMPTIGVNQREFKKGKVKFKFWDLAGQGRFRDSWEKYCSGSDCILFVVDSVDEKFFEQAKEELHNLLKYETLDGIPLLLLGNKNDLEGALSEEELIDYFDLKAIKNRKRACFSISAKKMTNLDVLMKWLSNLK